MKALAALILTIFFSTAAIAQVPKPDQFVQFGSWCETVDDARAVIATGEDAEAFVNLILSPESSCQDVRVAQRMGIPLPPQVGKVLSVVEEMPSPDGKYLVTILLLALQDGRMVFSWHVLEARGA